jgi:NAD(P)H-dependent FMN reductase
MKKILAMGGSINTQSINRTLATYTAHLVADVEVVVADLNDFELPLFSPDIEKVSGVPDHAQELFKLIGSVDGIVLSLAEYNGSYSGAFKNTFDWMSRIDKAVWQGKPVLLMAASPGQGGASHVLAQAKDAMPHYGANIVAEFSLPVFQENFTQGVVSNEDLLVNLQSQVALFESALAA